MTLYTQKTQSNSADGGTSRAVVDLRCYYTEQHFSSVSLLLLSIFPVFLVFVFVSRAVLRDSLPICVFLQIQLANQLRINWQQKLTHQKPKRRLPLNDTDM